MTRPSHLTCNRLAAGLGLEPRYTPPEGVVLPLDDPAMRRILADSEIFSASPDKATLSAVISSTSAKGPPQKPHARASYRVRPEFPLSSLAEH